MKAIKEDRFGNHWGKKHKLFSSALQTYFKNLIPFYYETCFKNLYYGLHASYGMGPDEPSASDAPGGC
jgi:hypothetical protein